MTASFIGWVGTVLYLGNHGLLAFDRIDRGRYYYAINLCAAALVTASSLMLASWQAVVVNGFWVVVSLLGLLGRRLALVPGVSLRTLLALCCVLVVVAAVAAFANGPLGIRLLGWSATALFCGIYLLYAVERISLSEFLAGNAAAAFCLVPVLAMDQNWPVVALELVWGALSVVGLVRGAPAPDP